jgi:hypothetical protein
LSPIISATPSVSLRHAREQSNHVRAAPNMGQACHITRHSFPPFRVLELAAYRTTKRSWQGGVRSPGDTEMLRMAPTCEGASGFACERGGEARGRGGYALKGPCAWARAMLYVEASSIGARGSVVNHGDQWALSTKSCLTPCLFPCEKHPRDTNRAGACT